MQQIREREGIRMLSPISSFKHGNFLQHQAVNSHNDKDLLEVDSPVKNLSYSSLDYLSIINQVNFRASKQHYSKQVKALANQLVNGDVWQKYSEGNIDNETREFLTDMLKPGIGGSVMSLIIDLYDKEIKKYIAENQGSKDFKENLQKLLVIQNNMKESQKVFLDGIRRWGDLNHKETKLISFKGHSLANKTSVNLLAKLVDLYQSLPDDLKNDIQERIKKREDVLSLFDPGNYTTKEFSQILSSVLNIDAKDLASQEKIFTQLSLFDKAGLHNIDKLVVDGWPNRYEIPESVNPAWDNPGSTLQTILGIFDEIKKGSAAGVLAEGAIGAAKLSTKAITVPVHVSTAASVGGLGAKGGAVLGSLICPGAGTAIGALIGGLGGFFASLFTTASIENKAWNGIKKGIKNILEE